MKLFHDLQVNLRDHYQWRINIVKFWTRPCSIFFIFMQFSGKFGQIIG